MRRSLFLVCLLSALSVAACGTEPNGTSSGDGSDDDDSVQGGGVGKDGGSKDGGKGKDGGTTSTPRSDGGGGSPPKMLTPTSESFEKDATDRGGLPKDTLDVLRAGGKSCTSKVLYPYDRTVFPAGLTPPTLMWEGKSDGAYLKLAYEALDTLQFETAAGPSEKGELTIDPADWDEIVRRTQGTNLLVTLSTKSGNTVSTCNLKWKVAQGAMTGSIFYNTYDSPDTNGQGAVMRLTLGQADSETYLKYEGNTIPSAGPCISCHSVSANGASLAASLHNYVPGGWSYQASSYNVTPMVQPQPLSALPESTFGAFTPDGSRILSIGNPECTNGSDSFPRAPNNFPLVPGPALAELHDTKTGEVVKATGLKAEWFMWMPQFAPTGDKVAFNHAKMGADGKTDRRELAVMDFDAATNTFSNLRVIVSNEGPEPSLDYAPTSSGGLPAPAGNGDCDTPPTSNVGAIPGGSCTGPCFPAWPFFTPDGDGVIYSMVSEPDFMSAFPGRDTPAKSELWYVDVETMEKVRLDTANKGLGDEDALSNYYPTMLPVQVGGYYWMFWTSTRPWGHRDFGMSTAAATPDPTGGILTGILGGGGASKVNANKKRIWVSAIKPKAVTEAGLESISDTSAPGFYLEGQANSGNVRAFATLNPCQQVGTDCTSGLDCCSGYCKIPMGADKGSCVPDKPCSDVNEKCEDDSDCCPAPEGQQPRLCLGGFCGFQIQ
jgi:hypothetical protein